MNTPKDNETDKLSERAKALFDDSVEQLDGATLSQLNQRRQAALAELSDASPARQWLRWAPVTGMAAAAVVAVVVLRSTGGVDEPVLPGDITDFEILISEDSLEMIEELEFYSWLDTIEAESPDNVG